MIKVLPTGIRQEKSKGIHIGKEENSLFVDDMIVYIENSGKSTTKKIELINEFSKIVGYKRNIQKSWLILGGKDK